MGRRKRLALLSSTFKSVTKPWIEKGSIKALFQKNTKLMFFGYVNIDTWA